MTNETRNRPLASRIARRIPLLVAVGAAALVIAPAASAKSAKFDYEGQPDSFDEPYNVEKFKVNLPVKKGEYLAIKAKTTSMVRCSGGGDNTLLHASPLRRGDSFRTADDGEGCYLLMQGVVKN